MVDVAWCIGQDMRRAALFLVVLLLAPLSSAWPIPEPSQLDREWVVVEEDGWTSQEWNSLRDQGLEPLRQISETEVIVWGMFGDFQLPEEGVLRGPTADGYRVILEPRLPTSAQLNILSFFNVQNVISAGTSSVYPTSFEVYGVAPEIFDTIPGIWWVEPILPTQGRSNIAADIMLNFSIENTPIDRDYNQLNGDGVIVGMADSGIELDHECFRDAELAIGNVGIEHRKIVKLNTSIDEEDNPNHEDFRHGTHLAGVIICDLFEGYEGRGIANGSRLIFQDIVNDSGWSEPSMDWLLAEDLEYGAIIHSYSWGDVTESYTSRSWLLDAWHREIPWSLAFIAPGNNPSKFYEPANARNVISVGGTLKDTGNDLFTGSSHGPTEEGVRGNFIVTPAVGIISASADGNLSSFNDDMRSSTGTSSSTALAAGMSAIIQQMVQEGYFIQNGNYTPSGAQLRVLLAMSAQSMEGGKQGSEDVGAAPNSLQGWGRPSLDNLVKNDIWIHDSFQMDESDRLDLIQNWLSINGSRPFESVEKKMWNGSGALGPFLKSGEDFGWNLTLKNNSDLEVFLSFNQRPFGQFSDDLNIVVTLPDGSMYETNDTIEGTERLKINASELLDFQWVNVSVSAKNVGVGNYTDMLGNDGDKIGFSLAVRGVNGIWIGSLPEQKPELDPVPDPVPVCVEGDVRPVGDKCNDCVCTDGAWICTEMGCASVISDKNPEKIIDVQKNWMDKKTNLILSGALCLLLTMISVIGVASFSNKLDKKRKQREISERVAIPKNKFEK